MAFVECYHNYEQFEMIHAVAYGRGRRERVATGRTSKGGGKERKLFSKTVIGNVDDYRNSFFMMKVISEFRPPTRAKLLLGTPLVTHRPNRWRHFRSPSRAALFLDPRTKVAFLQDVTKSSVLLAYFCIFCFNIRKYDFCLN